ncbi:S53 family peptidase [Leekyejoonella antrihumi]|uniref:Peptidase S53 n=1 Tax=Leekyejoonella antrihumi TaxID=1660198 RepID=A0A563E866_9MICO|nr:S53 family peptidase [Leekyejoonella antrihumi]TWP38014.1 peptidase S53 [Leekyejoonella antrihumi]
MTRRNPSRARKVAALGVAGGLGLTLTAAAGSAAVASPGGLVAVAGGVTASSLPGGSVFGNTDPNTPEAVSFVLKERGMSSLENQVESGVTHDLSVQQFARRYGQSPQSIRELTDYLKHFGIATTVYANGVNVSATGTAGEFDKALSVTQKNYRVPGQAARNGHQRRPARTVHAPNKSPMLPRSVARMVTAVLGLSNYSPFSSQSVHVSPGLTAKASGSAQACPVTGPVAGCNLPSDYAGKYGMNKLYKSGADGSGQTIGIVTLAALDRGAPETFWKKYAHVPSTGRTVSIQNIDGGPGAPSDTAGSGETDLDVEQSGGVAPGANVIVYQAPNTDAGWADAFFTAASQNVAGSVSSSWGESETIVQAAIASGVETPALQTAYDEAYLELGAQGQSTFLSAGDEGAYTASTDLGTTNLAVDTPADSPYVTSAGGTTLPWSGKLGGTVPVSVPAERAWGWDYLWQPIATLDDVPLATAAESHVVGGGGGYSTFEGMPSYQKQIPGINRFSAVKYLTPTGYQNVQGITAPTTWSFNPNPSVTTGFSNGRAEPDVSANADPETGYLLYEPSAVPAGSAALQSGWGGTSFVAPQFNGSTAVIDQALGHRVGLWNPMMYHLARGSNSPVTPINTSGTGSDNIFYTGTPHTLYNPAVGLGTPNLSLFASELGQQGHGHGH